MILMSEAIENAVGITAIIIFGVFVVIAAIAMIALLFKM